MKTLLPLITLSLGLMATTRSAAETAAPAAESVALKPADRLGEDWWKKRWESSLKVAEKGDAKLVFIGDSITQGWEGGGKNFWAENWGDKAANFGFSGDRTEHVLWRLDHGQLGNLKPEQFVIMIGTNNIGHNSSSPEETVEGIKAIVAKLRAAAPEAKILVLGVFPRGETPEDGMRKKVVAINEGIKTIGDGDKVTFVDLAHKFLQPDGTLTKDVAPDLLHLSEAGYKIWADELQKLLK